MPIQDDERERQMVLLFNLSVPEGRGRSDVDAVLEMEGVDWPVPFELKSTTRTSVSTVRDFGPEHIAKWRELHWLFAFYAADGQRLLHCYYASPGDMADWIEDKARYVRPDMVLAERAPDYVTDETLTQVLGESESFSTADARLIMKNQWRAAQYNAAADLPDGRYSRRRMVELLQQRCGYVIRRGATLNNPHISENYLQDHGLERITGNHAATLRRLVSTALDSPARPAALDPTVAAQAMAAESDDATA